MKSNISKMRFNFLLYLILMLISVLLSFGTNASADENTAIAIKVETSAQTEDEAPPYFIPDSLGLSLPLRSRARIPSGSLIHVPQGSIVTLMLPDSHVVRLGPARTSVRWSRGRLNSTSITVYRGQTSHSVNRLAKRASYRVVTPTSVSGVRGTEFDVLVGEDCTSKTKVAEGKVEMGKEEFATTLGADEETEMGMLESIDQNTEGEEWFDSHKVSDPNKAQKIESFSAEAMKETNKMSLNDFVEMASMASQLIRLAAYPPRTASDAANVADAIEKGLRIWQRMEIRKESMEARKEVTRSLSERWGISSEASDSEYAAFDSARSNKADSIGKFADTLEKLSGFLKLTSVITSTPVGRLLRHLPW